MFPGRDKEEASKCVGRRGGEVDEDCRVFWKKKDPAKREKENNCC